MKRCAACGQDNDDWRPFCINCGASYTGPALEPQVAAPPEWAPPAPPPPGEPASATSSSSSGGAGPGGERRRSPAVIAVAAVVAVVVAVAALVGLTMLGSSDHKAAAPTTTFPSTWDPRVADLVRFDSGQRDLDYTHPVKVVFLSDAAFKKRVTTDESKLTAKDRRELQHALEELRALGMVQGNVDLFARFNQLSGTTTLAFYDDVKKEIVIPGRTLDVEQRVTLAHELTHTLDDEHFDLAKLNKIGDQHETDAVTALIEGDAVWVQNRYEGELSIADSRAYTRSQGTAVGPDALEGVPKIFDVLQGWPYDIGPLFVDVLAAQGGQASVDRAFRSPPIDEEQVIDPISYLDGDQPGAISAPALPKGAKKLDSSKEFGALMWYLVLSERIDPHVALRASLGWGADAYTAAQEANKTCIEVHYRGETRHDNAEMLTALHQWIAALPKGMATVKANDDDTLSLHSCDPGVGAKVVTDRSVAAYQLVLFRTTLIDELVKAGAEPVVATCAADAVTDKASLASINAGKAPAILSNIGAMAQIGATCRATASTVAPSDQIDK